MCKCKLPAPLDNKTILRRMTQSIKSFGDEIPATTGLYGRHFYQDNGRNILAVAHLDIATGYNHAAIFRVQDEPTLWSPAVDDRLGAYVILDLLPKLGLADENGVPLYDVLLTEGEETMNTTARDWRAPDGKFYNWIFSFDRMGTDVVLYQYESVGLVKMLEAAKFKVGRGSYSDIAELDDLGCAGFNFGVGYHEAHGYTAHAFLNDTLGMAKLFVKWFTDHANTHFAYERAAKSSRFYGPTRQTFNCAMCQQRNYWVYEYGKYDKEHPICWWCYKDLRDKDGHGGNGSNGSNGSNGNGKLLSVPAPITSSATTVDAQVCEICEGRIGEGGITTLYLRQNEIVCNSCGRILDAEDRGEEVYECDSCGLFYPKSQLTTISGRNWSEQWCTECMAAVNAKKAAP